MDQPLRDSVRARAANCCEYCGLHQDDQPFFRHHVEHIVPRQHGGLTVQSNLALACYHCNLHKGPNLSGIDPQTSLVVLLFNPRTQAWSEHFGRQGVSIVGSSPTGRATVGVLAMNAPQRLQLRSLLRRARPDAHVDTHNGSA